MELVRLLASDEPHLVQHVELGGQRTQHADLWSCYRIGLLRLSPDDDEHRHRRDP